MPIDQDHAASPFNAVPPVVGLVALAMAVIEVVLELGAQGLIGGREAVGWRLELIGRIAFSGPYFDWMLGDPSRLSPAGVARLVAYPFVHAGFMHMAFAAVIVLALGKFVGAVLSGPALVVLMAGSAVAGALGHAWLSGTPAPLVGGMPVAYGLVGAFTCLLWLRARRTGGPVWPAFRLIGVLILFQLFFLAFDRGGAASVIAELSGFAGGFVLAWPLAPGGARSLAAWLRQR